MLHSHSILNPIFPTTLKNFTTPYGSLMSVCNKDISRDCGHWRQSATITKVKEKLLSF